MKRDFYLLKCILREIKYRRISSILPALDFDLNKDEPDLSSEKYDSFVNKVFDYYEKTYSINPTASLNDMSPTEILRLIEQYNDVFTNNNIDNLIAYLKKLQ